MGDVLLSNQTTVMLVTINETRMFFGSIVRSLLPLCLWGLSVFLILEADAQTIPPRINARMISSFSFKQLYGGGILLRGKLGNYPDSLNFILDTGSGGISLDSATAADLKIGVVPSDITINGIAGSTKAGFIYSQQLRFPGLTLDSLDFYVTDYRILTSFYGEKVNGIIGYTVLKNYVVDLDYDSSMISFYSKGTLKYPEGGFILKPYINFQPFQHAILDDARKIQSNFMFDIGANICLMISSNFDTDSTPIRIGRKRFVKEAEGVGGKIAIQTTVVRKLKLGPYRFRNVPVCVFDDAYNVTSYPYCSGIIGNDLLRRFNIILNYGNREIFLKPNSHFEDSFDYSFTGIDLYFVEGASVIEYITAGSPAEKAGLKEGDTVIGVNHTFSQSLSVLKDALMKTTGNIKVFVLRAGAVMEFQFKAGSIL